MGIADRWPSAWPFARLAENPPRGVIRTAAAAVFGGMSRASIACAGLLALVPACFDPTGTSAESTVGAPTSGDESSSSATTASTTASTADTSNTATSDPTGDPTGASSGDPTGASSDTDGSTGGSSTASETDPTATDPSTSSGDDGNTSGDSGGPVCAGQCAPDVPGGWQGPVVINEGADADPCPTDFPQLVHGDQHAELSPGNATCGCECGDAVGVSCGAVTVQQTNAMCTASQGLADVLEPNVCTFVSNAAGTYAISTPSLQVGGASCDPEATESIPAPTWGRDVRSCSAAIAEGCDGGGCLPSTPDAHQMCIWAAGEAACPPGPWSQQVITYGDVDDDRDCTACSCGTPTGSCGGYVELNNQGCGVIYLGDASPGTCAVQPAASHATYYPEPDASCTPSGGSLVGGVAPTDAITYCCM